MTAPDSGASNVGNSRERECPPTDICDGGDACWDICNAWRYGDDGGDEQ